MLYQIKDGTVSLGGETVLSHFDFALHGSEKIALVGANGEGKSTLLRLICGELSLDRDDKRSGEIKEARRLSVGYLPQHIHGGNETVEELIMEACPCDDPWDRDRFLYEQEYDRIFTAFGFSKEDKERSLGEFSGGQQVRIALIRLLLMKPDILLLDEPTNHLDQEMTRWLEQWIGAYDKAVVYVSHDRYFMDETADVVYEVYKGKLKRYVGNYSAYVEEKQKQAGILMKEWERQQAEVERLNGLIRKFHNKPRKASFARSRQKILDRMELMDKPDQVAIRPDFGQVVPARISGKGVVMADHLVIGYHQDKPLMELNLEIRRGQKIGILGPNGVGKSTFLKTLASRLYPLKGRVSLGQNVELAYYDQHIELGHEELSAVDHFHRLFPGLAEKEVRGLLSRWGLKGKEAQTPVRSLSGGERSRLRFAELFQSCPNTLILDEPVNHLDMAAREVLESALRAYQGTLLFVSHDRYFIDQVATGLLIFRPEEAEYYPFGYSHYMKRSNKRGKQLRAEEMAMVEDFRKVPDKEKGMLREMTTDQAYLDWKLTLIRKEMEPVLDRIKSLEQEVRLLKEKKTLLDWAAMYPDLSTSLGAANNQNLTEKQDLEEINHHIERIEKDLEKGYEIWTDLCIKWDQQIHELDQDQD